MELNKTEEMQAQNAIGVEDVMEVSEQEEHQPITLDAFRQAKEDIFSLIINTDEFMRANGVSSLDFVSDVFSTTSREKQVGIVIQALQLVKRKLNSKSNGMKSRGDSKKSRLESDEIRDGGREKATPN